MYKVFIDGKAGTTGLRIYDRLAHDGDIELLLLDDTQRKDAAKRKHMLNSCDIAFLCLPDEAAKQAVDLIENPAVKVIDASTAHRVQPGWAYGFPELSQAHYNAVRNGSRVCVPGCHASGFIALTYPLVQAGIVAKDTVLTCFSITGYSGGGNQMIAAYETDNRDPALDAPRLYATAQNHKHLPEMQKYVGLTVAPIFHPIVADYYSGMTVTVSLHKSQMHKAATTQQIQRIYADVYADKAMIRVLPYSASDQVYAGNALSGSDRMHLSVAGNDERVCMIAQFDNLGKGASGAAIQCMNIMLGRDETTGLI